MEENHQFVIGFHGLGEKDRKTLIQSKTKQETEQPLILSINMSIHREHKALDEQKRRVQKRTREEIMEHPPKKNSGSPSIYLFCFPISGNSLLSFGLGLATEDRQRKEKMNQINAKICRSSRSRTAKGPPTRLSVREYSGVREMQMIRLNSVSTLRPHHRFKQKHKKY